MKTSVLVIAGTGRPYLVAALNSLVSQDADWEAVVINSCSDPKDIASVEEQLAAVPDNRIRVVRYEGDLGYPPYASRKWNFGLGFAQGELVAFLDDDDMKGTGWIAGMHHALASRPDCAVALSGGVNIDRDGVMSGATFGAPSLERESLLKGNFVTTGQMVVRRSAIDQIGGFDEALGCSEDYDFCLRLAGVPLPWVHVDHVKCLKRDTGSNACYHADVCNHTQVALRRIIYKQGVTNDRCSRCGGPLEPLPADIKAGGWHWRVQHSGKQWEIYCGKDEGCA